MKDGDYSTPSEHYFNYISKHKHSEDNDDKVAEEAIINSLGIDSYLPYKDYLKDNNIEDILSEEEK